MKDDEIPSDLIPDVEEPEEIEQLTRAPEPAPKSVVPQAKSKPRARAVTAPEPEIFIEKVADDPEDLEEKMRAAERVAHKQRSSTDAAMTIILSSDALEVPKSQSLPGAPKYALASGKPQRESTRLATIIKAVAVLSIVCGVSFALTKKGVDGVKTPWQRLMERKEVLTATDTSMGEQAPAVQASNTTTTTASNPTVGVPVTAVKNETSALDPQVEKGLLDKCGSDVTFCYRNALTFVDEKKYTSAARFFEAVCGAGFGPGCGGLGMLFANGTGVEQSYAKAMEYYQKSCDLGVGSACTSLGFGYAKGILGAVSPQKALEAFQKACEKDVPEACTQVGLAFRNGTGVDRAPARAAEFFTKACRMNDTAGCDEAKASKFVH